MDYYTVKEAAEAIGKSAATVRRLVREGHMDAVLPLGYERGMMIPKEAIEKWQRGVPVR